MVHNLVLASADQAWSYGGSILTFLLPMLAFVFIASALFVVYTKPELIPGRRAPAVEAPVGATRWPGKPATVGKHAEGRVTGASGDGPAAPPADRASVE